MSEVAQSSLSVHVDWTTWEPRERSVLCFIIEGDRVVLIEKKRGLGAGKVNGPGGRIEVGETALEAAVRETVEEIGVVPEGIREIGRLRFQFTDGYSLLCTVFRADGWTGDLLETDEAKPFWCRLDAIPYERMWRDDAFWFPHLVNGTGFEGWFVFEGDQMLEHRFIPASSVG
jgi:8-oxo-dGTP diphosphatase